MSKYAHLADYLRNQTSNEVRLSFADIERVLGSALPPCARKHPAWWANSRTNDTHTHAHLWLKAGWEKDQINLDENWVVFRRFECFEIESTKAFEGYKFDRKLLARGRNATLAIKRKKLDNYTCQVCGFKLEVDGKFVIEVHHCDSLADTGETITSIEQLVSLCPTCHRIAHLRSTPYSIEEIRELRAYERKDAQQPTRQPTVHG